MGRRHRLTATAGVTALALLLTACGANDKSGGDGGTGGEGKPGGTLRILQDTATVQYDPARSQSLVVTSLSLVHRRLTSWKVAPGQTTTIQPDLATDTGTQTDGGKTWTFTLKDGVKFSDGTPITSADVKWGLERTFAPAFAGGLTYHKELLVGGVDYKGPFDGGRELDSIETPDAKTIVFKLNRPYGDWNWIASTPAFAPVPKGKGAEANYGENPVASGPYKLVKYQRGVEAQLERNEHYDKATDGTRAALPDKVVFQLSQQTNVISKRLLDDSGDDRYAFGASFASPAQLAQIQGNETAKKRLVTSGSGALAFLALNTQKAPLDNLKVRQAFQYAVDKTAYQVASAGGPELAGDVATTLITPGIGGREQFDLYTAPPVGDPDKAKALLAEAGFANGLDLQLVIQNNNNYPEKAAALQGALAKAGIRVTIRSLEEQAYEAEVRIAPAPTYDITLTSWQPDIPSANGNIQPLFQSKEIGNGGYNSARYNNPEVDKLIEEAQAALDPAEAGRKWAALDKRIMQDSPVVPLIYTRNSFLHGSKVTGFQIGDFPAYPDYRQVGVGQ